MSESIQTGVQAEEIACRFLSKKGLSTLEKNFRCRLGEIDLIMQEGNTIVFVEVRYRSNTNFGGALASISNKKQLRIIAAAQVYLQKKSQLSAMPARIDVIGITGKKPHQRIEWLQNAIEANMW